MKSEQVYTTELGEEDYTKAQKWVRHKTENKETQLKASIDSVPRSCSQPPSLLRSNHPTHSKIKMYSLEKLNKDMAFLVHEAQ